MKKAVKNLRQELINAEKILNEQYSFELAEPIYLKCLKIINENEGDRNLFVDLLKEMFCEGILSDEPIAFLMHVLQWIEIKEWAEFKLKNIQNPIANGRPLSKIISSFCVDWENREIYQIFK